MGDAIVPVTSDLGWTPETLRDEVEREKALRAMVVDYYKSQLQQGHHYYNLSGEGKRKPALAKEGSLNLCSLFKVVPEPDEPHETYDDEHYSVRFRYHLRSVRTGQVVAIGDGSCSTREAKYAYRWVWPSELDPEMKASADAGEVPSKKVKTKSGWTVKYRFPNPDLADTYNTVLKMASKRALVDASLKLPLVSELFTQDLEEQIGGGDEADTEAEVASPVAAGDDSSQKRLQDAMALTETTESQALQTARKMFGSATQRIRVLTDLSDEQIDGLIAEIGLKA